MQEILKKLRNIPLFEGLKDKDLADFLSEIKIHIKRYSEGRPVIMQGMPCKALYVLLSGKCSGEMSDAGGKVIKIEDFDAPYALASALLFSDDNTIPVTIWTRSEAEILVIRKPDLIRFCTRNELFLHNLLKDLANKFVFISGKLVYLQFKSLEEKVIYYLSKQPKDSRGWVHPGHSINELSGLFGVERPSLSRVLGKMVKDGRLVRKGKVMRLL